MRPGTTNCDHLLSRCVDMALAGIHREFPCQIPLMLDEPTLFRRPRDWTPAFYGCYDWHSAVHSHWLLVRWLTLGHSDETKIRNVRSALADSFTAEKLDLEYRFLCHPNRKSFERPYGLAWLLQLTGELRNWRDPIAATWLSFIEPLEQHATARFRDWLPKLHGPVRTGEHNQTAFSLGLLADWARDHDDLEMVDLVRGTALRLYFSDSHLPIGWEPSAHDFLSPSLSTADLLRRVLEPEAFSDWLSAALPAFPGESTLQPVPLPADVQDGKLAHFVGLNFSRAWMLDGISMGLPQNDNRRAGLSNLAQDHLAAGIPMLECNEYSVTHWVGTFAMYALTGKGLMS